MTSPSEDGFRVTVEEVEWVDPTPPKRRRRKPTPPPSHPSIAVLIEAAVQEGKDYFQAQVELLKLKAKRAGSQAAGAVAMFVAAIIFALMMLWWTFHTGEVALALVLPAWAASLIIWGILLLLVIVFGAIGAILALGAKKDAPNPKEVVQEDIETIKADIAEAKKGAER